MLFRSMNFRVVDEHGRQLAQGRQLSALKSQWGSQARGAFQALASLKDAMSVGQTSPHFEKRADSHNPYKQNSYKPSSYNQKSSEKDSFGSNTHKESSNAQHKATIAVDTDKTFTTWSFGELPELMEIAKGDQTLVGFPALVDAGESVRIEVFDEPDLAASKHRAGLRRLFALQIKDAIKYLEKNLPDLQKMSVTYMLVGKAQDGSGGGKIGRAHV